MSLVNATSLDQVLELMATGARPVAGGTDLVVGARHGKAPLPAAIVAIDRVAELAGITSDGSGGIRIGALTTHAWLESDPLIAESYSAIGDASALVGSPATRYVGTLGGNVMNASPAMDTGAPLMVLGADVELMSVSGTRRIELSALWTGPGRTSAAPDELCIAILVPARPHGSASAYVRLEYRRAMEIAVVGAAASVTLDPDGSVGAVRVALTAVAPTIIEVSGIAAGSSPADTAAAAANAASEQATPISDVRASDRYRRHCVGVMARRAVEAACRRAAGEHLAVPINRTLGIGAAS